MQTKHYLARVVSWSLAFCESTEALSQHISEISAGFRQCTIVTDLFLEAKHISAPHEDTKNCEWAVNAHLQGTYICPKNQRKCICPSLRGARDVHDRGSCVAKPSLGPVLSRNTLCRIQVASSRSRAISSIFPSSRLCKPWLLPKGSLHGVNLGPGVGDSKLESSLSCLKEWQTTKVAIIPQRTTSNNG